MKEHKNMLVPSFKRDDVQKLLQMIHMFKSVNNLRAKGKITSLFALHMTQTIISN